MLMAFMVVVCFASGGGLVALNMLLVFGGSLHDCGGGLVALNMLLVVVALFMLVVVVGGSLHALVVGGSQHALGGWPCFWWLSTCSWWPADVMLDARFSTPCTGGGSSTCPVLVYMVFLINTWPGKSSKFLIEKLLAKNARANDPTLSSFSLFFCPCLFCLSQQVVWMVWTKQNMLHWMESVVGGF
uniref:Uncharacterized protein n=1 Tax=Meloidogyne enterolobii TaxID=390850 RepID=A0A6V7XPY4_MELEN|nr:unnamed protein product [Meloidogyne enterolobii]